MGALLQDLRYGLRMLARNLWFHGEQKAKQETPVPERPTLASDATPPAPSSSLILKDLRNLSRASHWSHFG